MTRSSLKSLALLLLASALMGGCVTTDQAPAPFAATLDEKDRSMMRVAAAANDSGDNGTAINLYRRQSAAHPGRVEPVVALGQALLAANAAEEALPAFQRAAVLQPDLLEAHIGIGRANLMLRRLEQATAAFNEALTRQPANVRALNGKGVAADLAGRHEEAQHLYLSALEIAPDDKNLWNNLGLSLTFSRQYRDAVDILARIATESGATSRMRQNLALALGLSGREAAAAQVSRVDLSEEAVAGNLRFYTAAQSLDGPGAFPRLPVESGRLEKSTAGP